MGQRRSDPEVGPRVASDLTSYKERGGSLTALAGRIGVKPSAISKMKSGQPPGPLVLKKLAHEFGRSMDFYSSGKDRTQIVREVDKDARPVPLSGSAAAGAPMARIHESKDVLFFHFPESFLRVMYGTLPDPERAVLLKVEGDSMEDDLADGCLVFVDRGPGGKGFDKAQIKPGEIYMVTPPGEEGVTLKRVSLHEELMLLEASNRDRKRFPLKSYRVGGLTVPRVVRGRVVGKIERY